MSVPTALWDLLSAVNPPAGLGAASAELSERYRFGIDGTAPAMRNALDHRAYLATRMPATSAAVSAAIAATPSAAFAGCASALDLGSGPGSALWAICERLDVSALTAFERDLGLIAAGRELATQGPAPLPYITWISGDLRTLPDLPRHDLVTISYALNELLPADQESVINSAWVLATQTLLLIEPGTPRGAAVIARARSQLLAAGAHLAAPCTHAKLCPLAEINTSGEPGWCHANVRLPRSQVHRMAKGGALGYEDEPFSYLVVTRTPVTLRGARIVAPPCGCKQVPQITVCSANGLERLRVAKRDRAAYAAARRARWGGLWDPPSA